MINYTQIETDNLKAKVQVCNFLKSLQISKNHLTYLRKSKNHILINDNPSTIKDFLNPGDKLLINSNAGTKTDIKAIDKPLDIVFEDRHILLVNKPSGLSSMANRSHYDDNLAGRIVFYCQKENPDFVLRIVNRLDKDTQGLLLVAKNLLVYKTLLTTSKKVYHAVLKGIIKTNLENHLPILETIENNKIALKRTADKNGKPASTFIKPLQQFKQHTLCEIEINFGRTHQIRVHTSHLEHPIEGDYVYDKPSNLISHTALVCKTLSFYHPFLKKNLSFTVDYENEFKNLLEKIKQI